MTVSQKIEHFLDQTGWQGSNFAPLAGDASFRRYFRVAGPKGQNAMLMYAPPPHEDPRPFLHVTQYLLKNDFRAPQIFAEDAEAGFVLLEDFGDRRMREHIDSFPDDEQSIYRKAIETLSQLSNAPVADVAPYDLAAYLREVRLLAEWYMPAMALPFDDNQFDSLWIKALEPISGPEHRKTTVLRDYHAENIMLLPDDQQGLIDYQDALAGHAAYDLVSILQDARRDVPAALEAAMLDHYCSIAATGPDFRYHYALLGAQRNTKIIGIFTRLWKRDGKERYLDFLPRMWGLLERDLEHPQLLPLKNWFDAHIPQDIRHSSPLHAVQR